MAESTEFEDPTHTEEETEYDRVIGIVADGVVGAAGGLVGVAMMTVVLVIAEQFGAFSRQSFADLTELIGLGGYVPEVTVGFLIFLAGGMVPWPLLFASLREYLPGESWPVNGLFFGTALWTGFVGAFYPGVTGFALVLYLAFSLVAHWVYGVSLGLVFSYLSERPETLV
ncbi:DUF6789 family protein [Salinibaculum salinum]|uniref:DUF6789 family protein n=1 Tax=Salinibaculum salinum TaxID=3131996 RepID=UPI0030EDB84A